MTAKNAFFRIKCNHHCIQKQNPNKLLFFYGKLLFNDRKRAIVHSSIAGQHFATHHEIISAGKVADPAAGFVHQ